MRILIVDDEKLTRDGLIASIDWMSLSFDQVDQADDGVNAMLIAQKYPPDVLVTDVRMPRMNGIELVEKIQELNPNCSVIFMSGYSDKEYLMAAIKLRAVRYVEKPINPEEIIEALTQSVNAILQGRAQQKSKDLFAKEAASKYALKLINNSYEIKNDTTVDVANLREVVHSNTIFTTFIIKFYPIQNYLMEEHILSFLESFHMMLKKRHYNEIHFVRHDTFLVMHVFSNDRPDDALITKIGNDIKALLPKDIDYFISIGKTVTGPGKVFQSYNTAVILLQSSFFYEYGSLLTYQNSAEAAPTNYPHEILADFTAAIKDKNTLKAKGLADTFYLALKHNRTQLANIIKDVYYKLFMQINSAQYDFKLQIDNSTSDSESLLDNISNCKTLQELHQMLLDKIDDFHKKLQTSPQENSTIFLIRDYISKHYGDYSLSIKDISDHVHLSTSYLCTVFKTETGDTLNQYITDFRIEKSKQLLSDSRNKIIEVSNRVGYSDCNYFGKIFKKVVGLTPSEYREKEIR